MPRTQLHTSAKDYTPSAPNERKGFFELFGPAPEPQTELARYRILAPKAGVRVSPLCLGAMSLGDQWTGWMGSGLDATGSEKLLDAFYEAGGNFIDTSCNYQDEQSEMIIGEWMEKRGNRDEIVLATKYTTYGLNRKEGRQNGIGINYAGNHRKNLFLTVEDSLKKLRTSYIDLLYVHWWDYSTTIEEIMLSLNDLVKAGKVMYLGVSDAPAWIVAQANQYARDHALQPFVIYQGNWSLALRDMERDILPMARAFGMAIAPWGALGGGRFKEPEELKARAKEKTLRAGLEPTENELKVGQALKEVAHEIGGGVALANVALAWCRQMYPDCYPLIGGTKLQHLKSNIEALNIKLSPQQMEKLSNAVPFDWGFPYDMFGTDPHYLPEGKPKNPALSSAGHIKFVNYA
ncbi:oxidoreductase with NAD+ or NADP+ as acceptor [Saitozyma sp. JCM 24511]|nr:oxidoreductase with NAD+ or NADP+ as acceptor [Saitozyma sp. JCM 24511]